MKLSLQLSKLCIYKTCKFNNINKKPNNLCNKQLAYNSKHSIDNKNIK